MDKLNEALHILINRDETLKELDQQLDQNITKTLELLSINNDTLFNLIPNLENHEDHTIRWKFIYLLCHVLLSLKDDESMINIQYLTNVKKTFQFIVSLGILPNLIAGVGISINERCKNLSELPNEDLTIKQQYYRLTGSTHLLLLCMETQTLNNYIVTNHLNDLLASLLQLCYAKIKKPDHIITLEFYNKIMADRQIFQVHLDTILTKTYAPQIVQELMYFHGNPKSPKWLKIASFRILNTKLLNDGVESLITAIIGTESFDIGTKWQQFDVLVKLIMTKTTQISENIYYSNICTQLTKLLSRNNQNYELLVAACIHCLYNSNDKLCLAYLIQPLFAPFFKFSSNNVIVSLNTNELQAIVNVLHNCTCGTRHVIPSTVLKPIIKILFCLYLPIRKPTEFHEMSEKLSRILIKYISEAKNKRDIFDLFLFESKVEEIIELKDNFEFLVKNNEITLCECNDQTLSRSAEFIDIITNVDSEAIIVPLFVYLLEISSASSLDLLVLERKLISYNLLSTLVVNKNVQKHLKRDPKIILNFINTALTNIIESNVHKSCGNDSEEFQLVFLLVMVISILNKNDLGELEMLLNKIASETTNTELKMLISNTWGDGKVNGSKNSEYETAIKDVCDPLIPVRGHGLMQLAKLIENKNAEASANKQYILNLCLQQLKNDDSYIYLNAIRVLSALGTTFPDIIINNLTEEYATDNCGRDYETRMKVGEVLLRVVRNLGDAAPKYKSILLNTFLSGVRDEDHLIRASSLSNLGELCRVLGYKLGSVVSEVLTCIHAVISTDDALEARRAAVSVIRSLFIGLHQDVILYFKDSILPIYRTLKHVYTSDPDHITRLQAQLALEELNEIMRDFVLPKLELSKNVSMLK